MDIVTIQPSFREVIQEVCDGGASESFWVSRQAAGSETSHDLAVQVAVGPAFDGPFRQTTAHRFEVVFDGATYSLQAASTNISSASNVTAVAAHDALVAVGDSAGAIKLYDSRGDQQLAISAAHCADVTCLAFFPSGQVILSGSLDMTIKVWSVADGTNPRTMAGHTAAVTCVELLGATGRNFLSGARDGSVRLWETGSGSMLHAFRRVAHHDDPVTCMRSQGSAPLGGGGGAFDFETAGVLVYVGYESGTIQQYDVAARRPTAVKFASIGSAVTCLELTNAGVVAGHANGVIRNCTTGRQFEAPGPILSLTSLDARGLLVNSAGNLVVLKEDGVSVDRYLVGAERVQSVAYNPHRSQVISGGKEGVHIYALEDTATTLPLGPA
ncbi:Uncharacterized protein ABC855_g1740 [[Candida] zeylanoides]